MSQCQIFNEQEIASFRKAGRILHDCLKHVAGLVKPGVTTAELDAAAEEFIRARGGEPAFQGYMGYPSTLCTSINEECVHGMPGNRVLEDGDIISLDCGVRLDGLNTDACITVPVGTISDEAALLLRTTQEALSEAIKIVKAGIQVGDISETIQNYAEERGFKAVKSLTGHGLGKSLHQFPDIPNVGKAGTGAHLPANTVVAIEPIVSVGSDDVTQAADGWTLSTRDKALSAHFEHTVLITRNGAEIIS